ncbi:MAG TPA: hypothetical protein VFJ76_09375 [Solirubrobacterales bacterium]|nr:hypothetical protein [Solirubrobacterales bacterium]
MAVAVPRSRTAPAPRPSRTTAPPRPRKPGPEPARKPTRTRAVPAPAKAPARRAPARKPATRRAPAARPKLAVAAGRTAVAVRQLPDSGLVVRMTQGRLWIGVLGVLLVGIVALNVATLSFAAASGKIDEQITALEQENSMLESREAERFSTARIRGEAGALGLAMPNTEEPKLIQHEPGDAAAAAARLAAAGG